MRILQCYRFRVGTKIPFDKWPGIIDEFLRQQHLSHRYFHYYLENYDNTEKNKRIMDGTKCSTCYQVDHVCQRCRKDAAASLRNGTPCQRAAKEAPFLGPIKVRETQYTTIQSLDNFTDASNFAKDRIYAILPKIYRRYGFATTSLIYRDIDFFSQRIPSPSPEAEHLINGYDGSGITLYRSALSSDNAIILTVGSHYPGDVPDATPYADALGMLLPGIKRISNTRVLMDTAEQHQYEELDLQAKPLVAQAKAFFTRNMPEEKGNNDSEGPVSIASYLKKYAKRYGYAYSGCTNFIYSMERHLPSGHYICLEFVSSPRNSDADPYVYLFGLGFHHRIWADGFCPQNPQDATEYFTKLFEILAEAEKSVFPAILDLYPTTPDWFVPAYQ